jgi:molecular chaperone DnaK
VKTPVHDLSSFADDEPTQVGTAAELLASTRAMFSDAAAAKEALSSSSLDPPTPLETEPFLDPPTPIEPQSFLEPSSPLELAPAFDPPTPLETEPSFEPPTPIEPVKPEAPPFAKTLAVDDAHAIAPAPAPSKIRGFQKTMLGGLGAAAAPAPKAIEPSPPARAPDASAFGRTLRSDPANFAPSPPVSRQLAVSEPPLLRPALPLLVDVTPLSLCVETVGGYRDILIARNTPVPCEQSRAFVTAKDFQDTVCVRVGQGESERFADNVVLGELELSGLRAAPRGEAHVVVTFTLDTDGMLDVRAHDAETGNAATARLRMLGLPDQADLGSMTARHQRHQSP